MQNIFKFVFLNVFILFCVIFLSEGKQENIFNPIENEIREEELISFPHPVTIYEGEECQNLRTEFGICKPIYDCSTIHNDIIEGTINHNDIQCGWKENSIPLVCCPQDPDVRMEVPTVVHDISRPQTEFYDCGHFFVANEFTDLRTIYKGNETAEHYKQMGYNVTPIYVDVDLLSVFNVSNETHTKTFEFPYLNRGAVGGEDARRIVTVYMAILGERNENLTEWFCDGVIINRDWVLSAAHCFVVRKPNVIRLGEYDLGNPEVSATEFPMDFDIAEVVIYPEYKYPSTYHDLVLIRLNKSIPYFRFFEDMQAICLPWDDEINKNVIGKQVTLTGWGSTVFNGPYSPIIQEVNLTVFDTSVCDESYSTLSDYSERFPDGIKSGTNLCVGDTNGGKDACEGDSGGPVVYPATEYGIYTLAGIVSLGHGCGLPEFPGIYVPIHKPEYISWIKRVAFS